MSEKSAETADMLLGPDRCTKEGESERGREGERERGREVQGVGCRV